jgi:hypothetical protein
MAQSAQSPPQRRTAGKQKSAHSGGDQQASVVSGSPAACRLSAKIRYHPHPPQAKQARKTTHTQTASTTNKAQPIVRNMTTFTGLSDEDAM